MMENRKKKKDEWEDIKKKNDKKEAWEKEE